MRAVDRSDGGDVPDEWLAGDDESRGGCAFGIAMGVFGLPAVALLFAGAAATVWGSGLVGLLVSAGLVCGAIDWWRGRRAVVAITLAGPDEFVVRRMDGRVARYPFAEVGRVRATRDADEDDTLSMRISVRGRVVRTRSGPASTARTFLALCEEAGATVTHRIATSD